MFCVPWSVWCFQGSVQSQCERGFLRWSPWCCRCGDHQCPGVSNVSKLSIQIHFGPPSDWLVTSGTVWLASSTITFTETGHVFCMQLAWTFRWYEKSLWWYCPSPFSAYQHIGGYRVSSTGPNKCVYSCLQLVRVHLSILTKSGTLNAYTCIAHTVTLMTGQYHNMLDRTEYMVSALTWSGGFWSIHKAFCY